MLSGGGSDVKLKIEVNCLIVDWRLSVFFGGSSVSNSFGFKGDSMTPTLTNKQLMIFNEVSNTKSLVYGCFYLKSGTFFETSDLNA